MRDAFCRSLRWSLSLLNLLRPFARFLPSGRYGRPGVPTVPSTTKLLVMRDGYLCSRRQADVVRGVFAVNRNRINPPAAGALAFGAQLHRERRGTGHVLGSE